MAKWTKKKISWTISILLFIGFLLFAWRASVVRLTKNFYEVDPGKFYRSAQLYPDELEEVVKKYGIKTVISLRGAPQNSYWVPGQIETLKKLNVDFVPISWTSHYFPHKEDLQAFIKTLKDSPRPILVHCRSGADRTGEASAIYEIEFMGKPKEKAIEDQLSFKYWHLESSHPAKKALVRAYEGMDWALNKYDHCAPEYVKWAEEGHCSNTTQRPENK